MTSTTTPTADRQVVWCRGTTTLPVWPQGWMFTPSISPEHMTGLCGPGHGCDWHAWRRQTEKSGILRASRLSNRQLPRAHETNK